MSHGAVFPWDERFGGFDRSTRLWFDEPDPYGWPYPQLSLPSAAAVPIRVPQRVRGAASALERLRRAVR